MEVPLRLHDAAGLQLIPTLRREKDRLRSVSIIAGRLHAASRRRRRPLALLADGERHANGRRGDGSAARDRGARRRGQRGSGGWSAPRAPSRDRDVCPCAPPPRRSTSSSVLRGPPAAWWASTTARLHGRRREPLRDAAWRCWPAGRPLPGCSSTAAMRRRTSSRISLRNGSSSAGPIRRRSSSAASVRERPLDDQDALRGR